MGRTPAANPSHRSPSRFHLSPLSSTLPLLLLSVWTLLAIGCVSCVEAAPAVMKKEISPSGSFIAPSKLNIVAFVGLSRKSSRELLLQLEDLLPKVDSQCVKAVAVNRNYWMDKLYRQLASQRNYKHVSVMQDSDKFLAWKRLQINEPETVTVYAKSTNQSICSWKLNDFTAEGKSTTVEEKVAELMSELRKTIEMWTALTALSDKESS